VGYLVRRSTRCVSDFIPRSKSANLCSFSKDAPLDLETDFFYLSREVAIEQTIKVLSNAPDDTLMDLLDKAWKNQGTQCRGVNWGIPLGVLKEIVTCVGGSVLANIFKILAEDYATWGSGGMPDLLLWRLINKSSKLVEVKGPNDRLSNRQEAWIEHLLLAGFQVDVCHVVADK